jgi:hypothetical protein
MVASLTAHRQDLRIQTAQRAAIRAEAARCHAFAPVADMVLRDDATPINPYGYRYAREIMHEISTSHDAPAPCRDQLPENP